MADVKRIAIFGTESTGKTTLARMLANHFEEPWAAEYVREYWDTHDGKIGPADLDAIARGQIANEETAAARAARGFLRHRADDVCPVERPPVSRRLPGVGASGG